MNDAIAIHVPNQQFVALTPGDLPAAQRQVAGWCAAKIYALSLELKEQRENLREAKQMLWRNHGWTRAITRTAKRMIYYAKIKKAVEAGYLIVPNFNVDVVAVRVDRDFPPEPVDVKAATPQVLAPGAGHYVDNALKGYSETITWKTDNGERSREQFTSTKYNTDIDFPAGLIKPSILHATERAMALKLFDRIGIVRQSRRSDPIVVGQIIDPRETSPWALRNNPRCVTFFVAWWLDTKDL